MAQEAVAAEPESYAYLDTLGWVHFLLGELEEAERCLVKSLQKFGRGMKPIISRPLYL